MEEKKIEITEEQLHELGDAINKMERELNYVCEPIGMDEDALTKVILSDEYSEGEKLASKYAAMYTTLINFGMAVEQAYDLVEIQLVSDNNQKLQSIANIGLKEQANIIKSNNL